MSSNRYTNIITHNNIFFENTSQTYEKGVINTHISLEQKKKKNYTYFYAKITTFEYLNNAPMTLDSIYQKIFFNLKMKS